jgi:hypothetical protein
MTDARQLSQRLEPTANADTAATGKPVVGWVQ